MGSVPCCATMHRHGRTKQHEQGPEARVHSYCSTLYIICPVQHEQERDRHAHTRLGFRLSFGLHRLSNTVAMLTESCGFHKDRIQATTTAAGTCVGELGDTGPERRECVRSSSITELEVREMMKDIYWCEDTDC